MTQPENMQSFIQQAQEMQAQLEAAQREILESTITGQAGNGLVEVELKGNGLVTAVKLDPKVVDPEDIEGLQDLIVGAFAEAHQNLGKLADEKMGPLQGMFDGMGGPF